jgi:RHS repeat-associated protein
VKILIPSSPIIWVLPTRCTTPQAEKVWGADLDIYGAVRVVAKEMQDCPFRYPGQYADEETGLYYNRFRYYDADGGCYVSQDPIGLAGGNPTLYGYVGDLNSRNFFPPNKKQDTAFATSCMF